MRNGGGGEESFKSSTDYNSKTKQLAENEEKQEF